ncbi:MAG: hypothetical protein OEZ34_15930, partial [Spirochaetia bacterium]|nr:hypothetical protein [Spirochaetia bacterium]
SLKENDLLTENPEGCLDLKKEFNTESDYDIYYPIIGIITEKIDKLVPEDQLVLKVASILGKEFSQNDLLEIFPVEIDAEKLHRSLNELVKRNFLILNSIEGGYVYTFKRTLDQIVANNMLLFSQKIKMMKKLEVLNLNA